MGLPVSKCHLSSQSDEAQWMLDEILLLKYVSSSCQFLLHLYLYGLPGCLTYMQGSILKICCKF